MGCFYSRLMQNRQHLPDSKALSFIAHRLKTCGKIKDEIPLILQFWFKLNYYANQSYIVFKAASLKITYLNGIVQLLSISISNDDIAYLQNMMNVKFANRLKDLYTYNL